MLSRLEEALVQAADFLRSQNVPYVLIGGMARNIWAEPRTTNDVDFTVIVSDEERDNFIARAVDTLPPRRRWPIATLKTTGILLLQAANGVGIDFIVASIPFEESAIKRGVAVRIAGTEVRVICPEDLIVLKLIAGRMRDRADVVDIVGRQGARLDRRYLDEQVAEFSELLDAPRIKEHYDEAWELAMGVEEA